MFDGLFTRLGPKSFFLAMQFIAPFYFAGVDLRTLMNRMGRKQPSLPLRSMPRLIRLRIERRQT
jgi:hypothetical protein